MASPSQPPTAPCSAVSSTVCRYAQLNDLEAVTGQTIERIALIGGSKSALPRTHRRGNRLSPRRPRRPLPATPWCRPRPAGSAQKIFRRPPPLVQPKSTNQMANVPGWETSIFNPLHRRPAAFDSFECSHFALSYRSWSERWRAAPQIVQLFGGVTGCAFVICFAYANFT